MIDRKREKARGQKEREKSIEKEKERERERERKKTAWGSKFSSQKRCSKKMVPKSRS